jgi:hypothetical protein
MAQGLVATPSGALQQAPNLGAFRYSIWPGCNDERNFHAVFQKLAQDYPGYDCPSLFTYLHNAFHCLPSKGLCTRLISALPFELVNEFDNKRTLALKMQRHGCEWAFPPTFFSPLQAWQETQNNPGALFFMKVENQTKGQGMRVVARHELLALQLPALHVLQQAVQDLELVQGCKFVIRYYLFIHDKKIFLHYRGAIIVHGFVYDRQSTDYRIQIQHNFDEAGSACQLMSLHRHQHGGRWRDAIKQRIMAILPTLQPLIDATTPDAYTLIGGDALIESSGGAKLIEFNFFPAMFANSDEFNHEVSQPVLRDVIMKTLFNVQNEFEELQQQQVPAYFPPMPSTTAVPLHMSAPFSCPPSQPGPPIPEMVCAQ